MRFLGPAALVAVMLACGGTPDPGPFTINYALDVEGGNCASSQCTDYGMSCGAVLSIRITDAETGEVVVTNSVGGPQQARLCEDLEPSLDLCGLGNLPPSSIFFDLPPRLLRIEVAAWSGEALAAAGLDSCPDEDIFDLAGRPLVGFSPQPAFAGAVYFDAGSSATEALVSLSCSAPTQLDTIDCAPEQLLVRANVVDIETPPSQTTPSPLPDSLLVRAAGVRQVLIDEDVFTEVDSTKPIEVLDREGDSVFFSKLVPEGDVPNPLCVVVLEQTPQATTTVTCDNYDPESQIDVRGTLMPKTVLDQMLAAVELATFPPEGLVVGRVFDQDGAPLAGVSVTPIDAPLATVEYLNSSRDDTLGDRTFDNGYFIARDVPFGTQWVVSGAVGMVPVRTPSAGLVRNQLTLLPIPMRDDIAGAPKLGN